MPLRWINNGNEVINEVGTIELYLLQKNAEVPRKPEIIMAEIRNILAAPAPKARRRPTLGGPPSPSGRAATASPMC